MADKDQHKRQRDEADELEGLIAEVHKEADKPG
jgi:hypothetical protein